MLATQSFFKNNLNLNVDDPSKVYDVDSNTLFLLSSNTSNNSVTFTDSTGNNGTINVHGTTKHDTAAQKFGTTSILFDGNSDWLQIPDNARWDHGTTGAFTYEAWVKFISTGHMNIFSRTNGQESTWYFRTNGNATTMNLVLSNSGSAQTHYTRTITDLSTTWHHWAMVRESENVIKQYIDGVQQGATITTSHNVDSDYEGGSTNNATDILIGARVYDATNVSQYFNGYMDEIRISNVARWTANFSVS